MFPWKRLTKAADEISSIVKPHANRLGINRRAINMIPSAHSSQSHEIAETTGLRFHHLLVTLEGNQRTGVLKIINPRRKARSAILMYRGRVVGCLYGRKDFDYQCLSRDAYQYALMDLATPGNILDAYQLSDQLVLAAASLFHGHIIDVPEGSESALERALQQVNGSGLPGCIVVNTAGGDMLCMIYCAEGQVIGVYSASAGWLQASAVAARDILEKAGEVKIMASLLPMQQPADEASLGFSLTGLADRDRSRMLVPQLQAVDSLIVRSERLQDRSNNFNGLRGVSSRAHRTDFTPRQSTFAITP